MRMAMQAVTVSVIATPDGRRLTLSAYLLRNSNGLRTIYDWPRSPPGEFSKAYVGLWQDALRKSLVNPHNGQSSRTLVPGGTPLFLISGNGLNHQGNNDCTNGWDKDGVPGT